MDTMAVTTTMIPPIEISSKKPVDVQLLQEARPIEAVVDYIAAIEGPLDIYCWYEGTQGLPISGASFIKEALLEPLFTRKRDTRICLYSLKGWDFTKCISKMASSSRLGDAINRINPVALQCIYATSFFRYSTSFSVESPLYQWINEELPKKSYLLDLSSDERKCGKSIAQLFEDKTSLFDSLKTLDVAQAYAAMQYIEGYYLTQEAIKRGLSEGKRSIQVAFILPNDESKYYLDLPRDLDRLLQADFGSLLDSVDIKVSLICFRYGDDLSSRPYINKAKGSIKVDPEEIESYFDYLRI
ncbi:MAG: hypothetical protein HY860_02655 [Chlamydiales bacterium]|nr:hypothetical protein [Chlamydiales bacterium]